MADGLKIAPRFTLPLQVATEKMGILAANRAGKSNAAVVIAEEMYDAGIQWVAIDPKGDWWGIRGKGTAEGLPVLVLGGQHGDLPLEPTSGRVIAEMVVHQHVTCVLDVSEMDRLDMLSFLHTFAQHLFRINTEPLHLFLEEADDFIPQTISSLTKEEGRLTGAVIEDFARIVKRGGYKGLGATLITQRSADINNKVLTQIGTLIAMRTLGASDRKAVRTWLDYHQDAKDIVDALPELQAGEAYVVSPAFLGSTTKIKFRRRRTYDSGSTPVVGQRRAPANLADIDLDAVRQAMAATIEQVEANDPEALKKEVARLKRECAAAEAEVTRLINLPAPEVTEQIPMPFIDMVWPKRIEEILTDLVGQVSITYGDILREVEELVEKYPPVPTGMPNSTPRPPAEVREKMAQIKPASSPLVRTPPAPKRTAPVPGFDDGEDGITGPQRKMLIALAQQAVSIPVTTLATLATLTNYSAKGSAFRNPLSNLNSRRLVIRSGTSVEITEAGMEALGDYEPLPTGSALLAWWKQNSLKGPEVKIVEALEQHGPADDAATLAEWTEYSPLGSAFRNPLSHLRSLGLVTPSKVSPIDLMPELKG